MKCLTCDREFSRIGMAQHLAAHRRRREKCAIMNNGRVETYRFGLIRMKQIKCVIPEKTKKTTAIEDKFYGNQ